MGIKKNTVVRGCLVPSLKNKPLDGRQDVPTLADIVNIENPYVNFIFPVAETGKWYKVISLRTKVMGDLEIPDGEIDEYDLFGEGLTEEEKQKILFKDLAEQTYLKKEDATETYQPKGEYQTKGNYVTKEDADNSYQPKGEYQIKGDYATKTELKNVEDKIPSVTSVDEVSISDNEPTSEGIKLWVDTSVISDGGGNGGGSNTPGGDGGNDGGNEGGSGGSGETKKYETVNVSISADNGASITADVTVNGETKSVTSGSSVPWEVKYGTEYTIEITDVNGYAKPETLTFTAEQSIRNVVLIFNQVLITTVHINQTISDPLGIFSRIVDNGGIEAIRANSHRYTGKINSEGIMSLRQIDDADGTKYVDGTDAELSTPGIDVFMKLPKFYWKCENVATDKWNFSVAYGGNPDGTYKEWDGKDLIGVYEAQTDSIEGQTGVCSISGVAPRCNIQLSSFQYYVSTRGNGYSLVKWKHHCMMAMLFYTYYGNTDSQSVCGKGTSSVKNTGLTNHLGMIDTLSDEDGNKSSINFWGLENWWGNVSEFIGNIYVESEKWHITEDDGNVRNLPYLPNINNASISKMIIGEKLDLVPSEASASETTGYCDSYYSGTGTPVGGGQVDVMRSHNANSWFGGVSKIEAYSVGVKDSLYGTRLAYRGEYIIEQ